MANPAVQVLRNSLSALKSQAATARQQRKELQDKVSALDLDIAAYDDNITAHKAAITTLGEVP